MSASPQTYRPEIDGLRAVAIVSVVLYHAWPSVVPGGFVGVDVFFVISGYLITRIIVAPNFSFAHFYRRRIRRIFPALLVVLAATVALGQTLLPPNEYRNLLRYAIGGGLFVANIVAYGNDSYFSGASELKPLVHLWSLGVEEQFYLLWPVLVRFALARGVLTRAIAWTAIASLAVFLWWSESDPRAAFYLAPSRFWELLLGAVLAGTAWTGRASSLGSAAGLAMIAACRTDRQRNRVSGSETGAAGHRRRFDHRYAEQVARLAPARESAGCLGRPHQLSALPVALASSLIAAELRTRSLFVCDRSRRRPVDRPRGGNPTAGGATRPLSATHAGHRRTGRLHDRDDRRPVHLVRDIARRRPRTDELVMRSSLPVPGTVIVVLHPQQRRGPDDPAPRRQPRKPSLRRAIASAPVGIGVVDRRLHADARTCLPRWKGRKRDLLQRKLCGAKRLPQHASHRHADPEAGRHIRDVARL